MRLSPFSLSTTKMPSDTSGTPRARTSCARSRQHARLWSATRPLRVKLFMRHYTTSAKSPPACAGMENVRWQVPVLRQCVVRFEHSEGTDQHARGPLGADLHLLRPVLEALLEPDHAP